MHLPKLDWMKTPSVFGDIWLCPNYFMETALVFSNNWTSNMLLSKGKVFARTDYLETKWLSIPFDKPVSLFYIVLKIYTTDIPCKQTLSCTFAPTYIQLPPSLNLSVRWANRFKNKMPLYLVRLIWNMDSQQTHFQEFLLHTTLWQVNLWLAIYL